MSIPLPPGLGNNAGFFPFHGGVNTLSLYDCLGESPAFVPMQFTFNTQLIWKADLSAYAPRRPLQKISSLYIDALNSANDAVIFFPNTGWGIRIAAGTQFLVNDLAGKGDYVFYVSLNSQNTNPLDIINIFALNVNVPFFDTLWQYPQGKNNASGGNNGSSWFFSDPGQPGPPPDLPTISGMNTGYIIDVFPVLKSTTGPFVNTHAAWTANGDLAVTFNFNGASDQEVTGTLVGVSFGSCTVFQGPFASPFNVGAFTDTGPGFVPSGTPVPQTEIVTNATITNMVTFYSGNSCGL